jgi:hypothetical protein
MDNSISFIDHMPMRALDAYSKTITGLLANSQVSCPYTGAKETNGQENGIERVQHGSGSGFMSFLLMDISSPTIMLLKTQLTSR